MNMELGNITLSDAQKLKRLTHQLYKHIYAHYEEMEVLNEMTDESLILDIDILEKRHEEEIANIVAEKDKELLNAIAAKDKKLDEKDRELDEKSKELGEKSKELDEKSKELDEKSRELEEKVREITLLKKKLEEAGILLNQNR